jgi:hypothetical protein
VVTGGGLTEGLNHARKQMAEAGCVSGSRRIPLQSGSQSDPSAQICSAEQGSRLVRQTEHVLESVMRFHKGPEGRRLLFLKKKKQKDFSPFSEPRAGCGQ